jgi:uncharacterized protein YndB with AHSA1/START domain
VATEPVVETIQIRAQPEEVFRYFTEPAALTEWMGEAADLQPRPGGRFQVTIRGEKVLGQYRKVEPFHYIELTWGRENSDLLPPGSTQVDISLEPVDGGTLVTLVHRGLPRSEAPRHREGWRYYLSALAGRSSD